MPASETKLQQILEETRQCIIPLFQRPYIPLLLVAEKNQKQCLKLLPGLGL